MSAAAGALASDQAGDVANAASDSDGVNIALALVGVGIAYAMYKYVTTMSETVGAATDGVGGAGRAAGDFLGGISDWGGDNVAEGATDAARGYGDVVGDVVDGGGEAVNEYVGGAADVADSLNPTTSGPVIPGVQLW